MDKTNVYFLTVAEHDLRWKKSEDAMKNWTNQWSSSAYSPSADFYCNTRYPLSFAHVCTPHKTLLRSRRPSKGSLPRGIHSCKCHSLAQLLDTWKRSRSTIQESEGFLMKNVWCLDYHGDSWRRKEKESSQRFFISNFKNSVSTTVNRHLCAC